MMANEGIMQTVDGPVPLAFVHEMQNLRRQLDDARKLAEELGRENIALTKLLDAATK
tara:strand:- start:103 stop:273 length:171 start_codon:yes stop_codon:yes gene_type:complete